MGSKEPMNSNANGPPDFDFVEKVSIAAEHHLFETHILTLLHLARNYQNHSPYFEVMSRQPQLFQVEAI